MVDMNRYQVAYTTLGYADLLKSATGLSKKAFKRQLARDGFPVRLIPIRYIEVDAKDRAHALAVAEEEVSGNYVFRVAKKLQVDSRVNGCPGCLGKSSRNFKCPVHG